jgi:hypothetical protein
MADEEFKEVSHEGDKGALIHVVRSVPLTEEWIAFIAEAMHDAEILEPGEKWTIPIHISCGMEAEVVIRLKDKGKC